MPANTAPLQEQLTTLTGKVTVLKTAVASLEAFFAGLGDIINAKVTAALEADNAADQGSIDAATAAVSEAIAGVAESADDIVTAVNANTPPPPPAPEA